MWIPYLVVLHVLAIIGVSALALAIGFGIYNDRTVKKGGRQRQS
jgi:hypothetical protein